MGTFAVQLAKAFGAEVTAVCSAKSVETARAIGADHVIDYTREDFTKRRRGRGERRRETYDLILGVNGYHSLFAYRRALRRKGTCVLVGASSERLLRSLLQVLLLGRVLNRLGSKKVRLCVFKSDPRDYPMLNELLESGKVVPVIDRSFPLAETAEALRYLESGHPRGKIVITVS